MNSIEEFIDSVELTASMQDKLRQLALNPEVKHIVAYQVDGKPRVKIYSEDNAEFDNDIIASWSNGKETLPTIDPMTASKTMQAVELHETDGISVYAAAKQLGIHPSAVHRAIARRADKKLCPCCQQVVREGFQIDPSVLRKKAIPV